uniref:Putative secreted protein n=1 Tax=Anopheles darlingi TaxID=43151 RepID=A0A2M4D1N9_ANODA
MLLLLLQKVLMLMLLVQLGHRLLEQLVCLTAARRQSNVDLHRSWARYLHILRHFGELHHLGRFVVILSPWIYADDHSYLALTIEIVLEEMRNLRITVRDFFRTTRLLIFTQNFQAGPQRH